MSEEINETCFHFKKIKTQGKKNELQCQKMFYKKIEIETKKKINKEKLNKNKNRYFLHFYHTLK